ncbi:P-loop containing nucleoside triphosphate hydrolase protein [Aaosphaeria arxii CBS 175.79]|uniref:P-loop containing nucleoside triphosphate hydrolase protein n=1 Tax=Aaosphaeria arxii CBS 175.79 TaxID=1450172 RepID=A0A6A5XKK2_9PLEO|nr:P-loop containing nucleoside triphosphate hydrolase protein [Aaosphaeria arxii CBS 175.79]KAF2013483.1 P-loop containing nucleoside triphosphate hydrolase protein [Aaosphaeria arxii CBS 175.79]
MPGIVPEPDSLEQLQSVEQIELLDAIDNLRSQGVNQYEISLPQLIVCGDQSSGKSSVLEGLTHLRFPTKEGLCTTFATEVVLRKDTEIKITCSINPAKNRTPAQQHELAKFQKSFSAREDFDFSALVEKARKCMGFGDNPETPLHFDDVLRIHFAAPDLPSLTIVDLPGVIQSQVGGQKVKGDQRQVAERVKKLVAGYMSDNKSIILAVVSARSDPEVQAIIGFIEEFDPKAERTLGIITKPDTLYVGLPTEARFVKLLKNELTRLQLGWHAVKNRSPPESKHSNAERDQSERDFFNSGIWATVPRSDVGIDALRSRLSSILLRHIRNELPSLVNAIENAVSNTDARLKALGDARESQQQQRIYLTQKAERFQFIISHAVNGTRPPSKEQINEMSLRSEIQNLGMAFADVMRLKGHTWNIIEDGIDENAVSLKDPSTELASYDAAIADPQYISRGEFLQDVIGMHVRNNRMIGLDAILNPWVIGGVFRQYSEPWEHIARMHLKRVFEAVEAYVEDTLQSLTDDWTYQRLMYEQVGPHLHKKREELSEKLEELLIPYQHREPSTHDPRFSRTIRELRQRRGLQETKPQPDVPFSFGKPIRPRSESFLTQSADDPTNEDIMNLMQAYYSSAITVFIDNVSLLAVENCLVHDLASLFSPTLVSGMSNEQLEAIASESKEITEERAALRQKLRDLEAGRRILSKQACQVSKPSQLRPPTSTPRTRSHLHLSSESRSTRDHTPTPSQHNNQRKDTSDDLISGFGRISISPPRTQRAGASSARSTPRRTTPSNSANNVFTTMQASPTVTESETDDERGPWLDEQWRKNQPPPIRTS